MIRAIAAHAGTTRKRVPPSKTYLYLPATCPITNAAKIALNDVAPVGPRRGPHLAEPRTQPWLHYRVTGDTAKSWG